MNFPSSIYLQDKRYDPVIKSGERIFAKLLPDTRNPKWNYVCRSLTYKDDGLKPDSGYPQMIPFRPRVGSNFTAVWQWWVLNQQLCNLFGFRNYAEIETNPKVNWNRMTRDQRDRMTRWFNSMFDSGRFLTNDKGVDYFYNAIAGINLDKSFPKVWEVACAVNLVELVSNKVYTTLGEDWYEIYCLNSNNAPPPISQVNFSTRPDLIHAAVTWQYNSATQKFTTGDFPQLSNVGYQGHSLYPLMSPTGKVFARKNEIEILSMTQPTHINHFEI